MTVASYAADFRRLAPVATRTEPDWLTRTRHAAIEAFHERGFPTPRDEEWRFTNVRPIAEAEFVAAAELPSELDADALDTHRLPDAAAELVFVNGRYAPDLSHGRGLSDGVRAESLAAALASHPDELALHLAQVAEFEEQPFTALNTAFWADGAFVCVPAGAALAAPVHLLFVSAPIRSDVAAKNATPIVHPRVLIVLDHDSQASVIESYVTVSRARAFTNAVTEIVLGDHAMLHHVKVQRESVQGFHVAMLRADASANATLTDHSMSLGGAIVRNDILATLDGEGGECTLNGLYVADGTRLVDNHTTIDHAKPHCSSREMYKGILAGRSRGVFNGKIVVRPDAQKTDAKQTNKALLLSGDAQINTKPQLEIFANDVKCTHGAAVGQTDEDALFYLRARGVPLRDARNILIQAFAGEVLKTLTPATLRARLESELLWQLSGREAHGDESRG